MFEFHGKITDMKHILKFDQHVNGFIENIWYFYTAERMHILKSVRYILENYDKTSNFFQHVYGKYVDVLVPDIFASSLKQLSCLLKEISPSIASTIIPLKLWIDRNNREQLEIVLSLMIAMKHLKIEMAQYTQMVNVFKEHNFTNQPFDYHVVQESEPNIIMDIKCAELSACVLGLQHCWLVFIFILLAQCINGNITGVQ